MDEPAEAFRVVLRGYDPTQVNRRLDELTAALAQAVAERDALAQRLADEQEALDREPALPAPAVQGEPTFEHLGERVGQILSLAAEEAAELRRTAEAEVAAERDSVRAEAGRIREEADRYAADTRSAAETEATRIVEDARRAADEHRDEAERQASARIQDAEALYEEQRAKAVQATADFESTLADRRKAAEQEFQRQMQEVERRLAEAHQTLEEARTEAQQVRGEARREASELVRSAEERSRSILDEAEATAARIRAEFDRELAAAVQRRDAINAQLGNVREMLATLTGSVTPADPAPDEREPGDRPKADAEPAETAELL